MIFRKIPLFVFILPLLAPLNVAGQDQDTVKPTRSAANSLYAEDNEQNCLKCHGKLVYSITDTVTGLSRKELMAEHNFISPDAFYNSVHWSFNCLDCHSEGFKQFPHAIETRFETGWSCLDCHGYDPTYAQYKFEEIDAEYQKSIHYTATDGAFTCWQCHDAHYYTPMARESGSLREIFPGQTRCVFTAMVTLILWDW